MSIFVSSKRATGMSISIAQRLAIRKVRLTSHISSHHHAHSINTPNHGRYKNCVKNVPNQVSMPPGTTSCSLKNNNEQRKRFFCCTFHSRWGSKVSNTMATARSTASQRTE